MWKRSIDPADYTQNGDASVKRTAKRFSLPLQHVWTFWLGKFLTSSRELHRAPDNNESRVNAGDVVLEQNESPRVKSLTDNNSNKIAGAEEQIVAYENTLHSLFNKHAPWLTRTITVFPPQTPWFTDDLRELRREKGAVRKNTCPLALQSRSISIKRFVVNTTVP